MLFIASAFGLRTIMLLIASAFELRTIMLFIASAFGCIIFLLMVAVCFKLICCCRRCFSTAENPQADVPLSKASRVSSVSAVCNGADGSIEVKWVHRFPRRTVTGYNIHYAKIGDRAKTKFTNININCNQRHCTLTSTTDGIEPLNIYEIRVRPKVSVNLEPEWVSATVFVVWYCQYPGCMRHRRRRNGNFSRCCSADHAEKFSSEYCLFPECTLKCQKHFCKKHLPKAVTNGICGLVKLDSASNEYVKLKRKFSSSWCEKKGRLPEIYFILQIINPSAKKRFGKYVASLPWWYRTVEQYYHGTQLTCDMLQYYEPCTTTECGTCGIAKTGFDPKRINTKKWQRYGKGFYFAPNSSKAYEYPLTCQQSNSRSPYRCILVCDIAVGHKYTLYYNDPNIEGPPSGYHSIYGKSSWMWFWTSPDLNYDELVIFEANAIRPSYILFCENTTPSRRV